MKKKNIIFTISGIAIVSFFLFSFQNTTLSSFLNYFPRNNYSKNLLNLITSQKETTEKDHKSAPDFFTDSSFQKFLDDNHTLTKGYNPEDITQIISDFTYNKSKNFYLREEAAIAFADMARAFSNAFDFKTKLSINSARRSPEYQRKLSESCSNGRCAKPGTSEHEAGLALDIGVNGGNIKSGNGKYYQRLLDNAHLYGFHNTYQKGIEIDGKIVEPRHWRYVGVDLATTLHENNQTIAEYFYSNIEINDKIISDNTTNSEIQNEDIEDIIKLINSLE